MTQIRRPEAGGRRSRGPCLVVAAALALVAVAAPAGAQTREAIRYTLRFPAPQTNYVEVEAIVPTDGRAVDRHDDGGLDAGVVPGSRVRAERRGGHARSAGGRRAAGREDVEEPLADHDRRGARGDAHLSRLLARDDRPQQLGRRRLRDAERRADVPHAGRERRARRTTCGSSCRRRGRRRSPACPTRPTARRTTTARPTTTRSSTARSSPAIPPIHRFTVDGKPHLLVDVGEGGVFDGAARRPRSRTDRPGGQAVLGLAALRQVRLLQPARRRQRRARAQEFRDDDGEPLGDRHARANTSRG